MVRSKRLIRALIIIALLCSGALVLYVFFTEPMRPSWYYIDVNSGRILVKYKRMRITYDQEYRRTLISDLYISCHGEYPEPDWYCLPIEDEQLVNSCGLFYGDNSTVIESMTGQARQECLDRALEIMKIQKSEFGGIDYGTLSCYVWFIRQAWNQTGEEQIDIDDLPELEWFLPGFEAYTQRGRSGDDSLDAAETQ